MTVTGEMAARSKQLIMEHLADGEWHAHQEIVKALRGEMNQHALRDALQSLRTRDEVDAKFSQPSYRHGKSWSYRRKRS